MEEDVHLHLILRCLSGQATINECCQLETWLRASLRHRALYDRIDIVWQNTSPNEPVGIPDRHEVWQKIEARRTPFILRPLS